VKNADVELNIMRDLSTLAEHSIAKKTWSTYRTAKKMLEKFCSEKRVALILPISEEIVLKFVHWLLFERNLTAASVS
jgi:hypothetical protein